jgi:peptidoglycan/xylan/chitin deacetylase (PgdA/CDA1 family)
MTSVAHGIMFHHFHGQGHHPSQGSIDTQKLADMIDFLGGHSNIIDANLWLEKAVAGRLEPNDLCLTFDDALLCQKEIAVPVLKDLGHTAFFFVYSSVFEGEMERLEIYRTFRSTYFDNVEDFYGQFFAIIEKSAFGSKCAAALNNFSASTYLPHSPFYTDDDRKFRFLRDDVLGADDYNVLMDQMIKASPTSLEELSRGIWMKDEDLVALAAAGNVVGLHSYTHPTVLSSLSAERQDFEYTKNINHLERVLGDLPSTVSHPCNSYDTGTLGLLNGLGIQLGFRATMSEPGKKGLEYPREDHANIVRMMG